MTYENCMKCPFHKVLSDPDPFDDFCDDDQAVQCTRSDQQPTQDEFGRYNIGEPMVTVACRPYQLKQECDQPQWCPLTLESQSQYIRVIHRGKPDIYDIYKVTKTGEAETIEQLPSRGHPDNVLRMLAELSKVRPLIIQFIEELPLTGEVNNAIKRTVRETTWP